MQNHALIGDGVSAPLQKGALPMIRATADGHIAIGFIQDREFQALCRAIEREEPFDERFATAGPRAAMHASSRRPSTGRSEASPRASSSKAGRGGRALRPGRRSRHDPRGRPGRRKRPTLRDGPPDREPAPPAKPLGEFGGTPTRVERGAPGLGEHTREVAREAGYADADIDTLLAEGVLAVEERG